MSSTRFLKSRAVMVLFGYKNRSSFHQWVKSSGVPHVRLNQRRIVFEEAQLSDWVTKHSVGAHTR